MLANAVDTEFLRLCAKEKEKNNVARGARTRARGANEKMPKDAVNGVEVKVEAKLDVGGGAASGGPEDKGCGSLLSGAHVQGHGHVNPYHNLLAAPRPPTVAE